MKNILDKINRADETQSKVELRKYEVELNKLDEISKEFKIGSDLKTLADSKMRQCEQLAKDAQNIYNNAIVELKDIEQQIAFVDKQAAELGLQTPSGFSALNVTVKKLISDIAKIQPAVKRTQTLFP